jgi:PAS domain-containing protein
MLYRILQPIISGIEQLFDEPLCHLENTVSAFLGAASLLPAADSSFTLDATLVGVLAAIGIAAGISWGVFYRRMSSREEHHRLLAQNSEAQLRAMLTMTDDAVLLLDAHGVVRAANVAAEEMFSIAASEFEGIELTQFIPQPLCLGELTRRGPVNFDSIAMRPGGHHVNVNGGRKVRRVPVEK